MNDLNKYEMLGIYIEKLSIDIINSLSSKKLDKKAITEKKIELNTLQKISNKMSNLNRECEGEPILTELDFESLLEEKIMKSAKNGKKWSYRCEGCDLVYNSEEHGKYILIDVFALEYQKTSTVLPIHEGTLFCTKECAKKYYFLHI